MNLSSPITDIKGVGDKLAVLFNRLKISSVDELIHYYPRRYDDYSIITKIAELKPGPATVEVELTNIGGKYLRRGMHLTEAIARDDSGSVRLVWFNQPYRATSLRSGTKYFVSGVYELKYQRFSINNPSIELKKDFPLNTARIVPKYPETKGLTSNEIRKTLNQVLPQIEDYQESLPVEIVKQYDLIPLAKALLLIHFPKDADELEAAKRRLGFEEVFSLVLASQLNKLELKTDKSQNIQFDQQLAKQFVDKLKFKLTDDQRRAIWQIYLDMDSEHPMNRLVEGDVGSGKTVVAVMGGLMVINQGRQVALMAPTELLALQHATTIHQMLKPLGLDKSVCLLIGSLGAKQKKLAAQSIASGKAKFIIGTHALIQEHLDMDNLSLAVIDEQHRFGVNQRQALNLKAKSMPHVLSLSATPIPRSLALTLFGELDISRLKQKPIGRKPIETKVISESQYDRLTDEITKRVENKQQVFIVCPAIEQTSTTNKHTAAKTFELVKKRYPKYKVGLVHGKLSSLDKNASMQDFIDHKIDILVATTVIEVGIDIPAATTMVILSSDNFGLAQLHQLRGRVGRGDKPGICYLVHDDNVTVGPRLKALETSNDGFELAELDLKLRGPGAIYGHSQHGVLDLRIARLTDTNLIIEARNAAKYFVSNGLNLVQYEQLANRVSKLQKLTNLN
ncbi:MAG TPA: ATP-dependent DNA helicase RecG [Candidatus Saccharimonadales bacterium]